MPVSGMGVVCIRDVLAGVIYICLYQGCTSWCDIYMPLSGVY